MGKGTDCEIDSAEEWPMNVTLNEVKGPSLGKHKILRFAQNDRGRRAQNDERA